MCVSIPHSPTHSHTASCSLCKVKVEYTQLGGGEKRTKMNQRRSVISQSTVRIAPFLLYFLLRIDVLGSSASVCMFIVAPSASTKPSPCLYLPVAQRICLKSCICTAFCISPTLLAPTSPIHCHLNISIQRNKTFKNRA